MTKSRILGALAVVTLITALLFVAACNDDNNDSGDGATNSANEDALQ